MRRLEAARESLTGTASDTCTSLMYFAFFPLLVGGMFLGMLVVVGQGSKQGAMQTITALVLLADVLFKVGATLLTEGCEYALHRRVQRRLQQQGREEMVAAMDPTTEREALAFPGGEAMRPTPLSAP